MRLVDDNQIPSAIDDGFYALLIILFHPFIRPAGVLFYRLDGIHGRDDPVKLTVHIVIIGQTSYRIKIRWQDYLKFFMEFLLHFNRPLTYQSGRTNDQDTRNQATSL